jgi:hypothetical protein
MSRPQIRQGKKAHLVNITLPADQERPDQECGRGPQGHAQLGSHCPVLCDPADRGRALRCDHLVEHPVLALPVVAYVPGAR